MNKPVTHKQGFTLIELLIASVVFITVALLATGTLVSTIRIQGSHKQSQTVSLEAATVLSAIKYDIESSGTNTLRTYTFANTYTYGAPNTTLVPSATPDDSALIVVVPVRDATGAVLQPATTETHVYCAELQNVNGTQATGKRIVRYVLGSTLTYNPAGAKTAAPSICSDSFISQAFLPISLSMPQKEYLTDAYFEVHNLRFWPAWSFVVNANPPTYYDVNPDGIRTELVGQYNAANGASLLSTVETRFSAASYAPPPLVFRSLTGRKRSYKINN
jgi:prepilin-type N-terminal cleavage/methylation domain-containing protein